MENVILIGMPGCGKSTVGVVLAKDMNMDFIDADLEIQKKHGATLAQLIERHGDEGFRAIENDVNAGLTPQRAVIATGGSVIYGAEAMAHLRSIGTVIYLQLPYEEIEDRLGDLHARGVTFKPGQNLRSLYDERCPLYERYAHIVLRCAGLRLRHVVKLIEDALAK